MSRILLLFLDRQHDIQVLSEWLTTAYETIVPSFTFKEVNSSIACQQEVAAQLTQPFDLCILDSLVLNLIWNELQAKKDAAQPIFLPFLVITSRDNLPTVTPHLWQTFDELLLTPIEKTELQARVEILLRSRQLSLSNHELLDLNDRKSRFVSLASHELRNPLSAILFSAQILQQFGDQCAEEAKLKYFQLIQERVQYMTELLDGVLLISKADVGKLEFNPTILDVENFCRALLEQIQMSASNTHTFSFEYKSKCAQAYIDEKLLQHILSNLLCNAVKYSPEGGNIKLEVYHIDEEIIFRVQDQGIGIPAPDQLRLFESFKRGTNVGKIIGTGLGLAIAKQCIDMHGGNICVDSQVGVGTTFTVTLPTSINRA